MGTKPDKDVYEAGVVCPTCESLLFMDITPKYVEALFVDIKACPRTDKHPPNGIFRMTQTILPCVWQYICDNIVVTWQLLPDRSILTIHEGVQIWFSSEIFEVCLPDGENLNTCVPPQDYGFGGWGSVYWGPKIGPPPIDPGYEVGLKCITCNATLFNCFTPKYVEVIPRHIKGCASGTPVPNHNTVLTQIAPCVWQDVGSTWTMTWTLGPVSSSFVILDWLARTVFSAGYAALCGTHFENGGVLRCIAHPLQQCYDGEADIVWGDEMTLPPPV